VRGVLAMLDRLYVESQRWRNLVHILTVYSLQDGRLARIVQPTAPPPKKIHLAVASLWRGRTASAAASPSPFAAAFSGWFGGPW